MVTGPFKLVDLAQRRLTYVVGQLGLLDSRPIVLGPVGLVLRELLLPVHLLGVNSSRVGSCWIGPFLCG